MVFCVGRGTRPQIERTTVSGPAGLQFGFVPLFLVFDVCPTIAVSLVAIYLVFS